jgi:SAM-dependent methyltransferase
MERREAYPTDTQHIVNLSGYVWAVKQLAGHERSRVLDVACGTGYGSDYLSETVHQVVGIDVASGVVSRCRAKYSSPRIAFLGMDGAALGFRSGVFDAIVSQDTIEHVPNDCGFVAELSRVLRPGGVLVLFTPQGKEPGRKPDDPFHIREYTRAELLALLNNHFTSVQWFGRRQGSRLRDLERHMDSVRRWDPLSLRRLIPRWIRHRLGSLVSLARGGASLNKIVPDDIHYVEGTGDDTNLIALCVK